MSGPEQWVVHSSVGDDLVSDDAARPAMMLMDAWRDKDAFIVEFDLPGIDANSIDLDVERNVLTVRADRPAREGTEELVAAERPRGVFSRQLIIGDNLDTEKIAATYQAGVLRLEIPVAEKAKPRKISVNAAGMPARPICSTANGYDAHDSAQELTLAHETFEAIGARSLVERARAGLRSSEPAGRRTTPDTEHLLTSRELTIAQLAAARHLNRVIATAVHR